MVNYDNLQEGKFDHSIYIEDSILNYIDISINEEFEIEDELLTGDTILDIIDIVDDSITQEIND